MATMIVKKSGSSQVWITDLIFKRLVNDQAEEDLLAYLGAGRNGSEPYVLAATFVDDLSTVPRGG